MKKIEIEKDDMMLEAVAKIIEAAIICTLENHSTDLEVIKLTATEYMNQIAKGQVLSPDKELEIKYQRMRIEMIHMVVEDAFNPNKSIMVHKLIATLNTVNENISAKKRKPNKLKLDD